QTIMKKGIHPEFYKEATIRDNSSGAVFNIGSTVKDITVEISSVTHPFYTGKQRIVDTDNLVDRFQKKLERVDRSSISKKKTKKVARRTSSVAKVDTASQSLTLKDMLKQFK